MYGIYTYITFAYNCHENRMNVGKCTIVGNVWTAAWCLGRKNQAFSSRSFGPWLRHRWNESLCKAHQIRWSRMIGKTKAVVFSWLQNHLDVLWGTQVYDMLMIHCLLWVLTWLEVLSTWKRSSKWYRDYVLYLSDFMDKKLQGIHWDYTSERLTGIWKMIFLLQGCILRFHVNLPGCNFHFCWTKNLNGDLRLSVRLPKLWPGLKCVVIVMFQVTLLGTNRSHPKAVGKMNFLSHWWDMLVPRRVGFQMNDRFLGFNVLVLPQEPIAFFCCHFPEVQGSQTRWLDILISLDPLNIYRP